MTVGYSIAVCGGGLLQLVVLEAVKRGSVALRGGAEQLLCSSESPVFLLVHKVSWTGEEHSAIVRQDGGLHLHVQNVSDRKFWTACVVFQWLTCASAGWERRPRFTHFLVGALAFVTVVVGDACPTWTLWTYKNPPPKKKVVDLTLIKADQPLYRKHSDLRLCVNIDLYFVDFSSNSNERRFLFWLFVLVYFLNTRLWLQVSSWSLWRYEQASFASLLCISVIKGLIS